MATDAPPGAAAPGAGTADALSRPPSASGSPASGPPAAAGRSSGTLIARWTARRAARWGLVWGVVLGLYIGTGALTYSTSYKTPAERARLVQLFGSNVGLNALVGPARRLDTVGGFTAWKYLAFVGLIVAVWGLLTGSRLLRGEEDAGRWELLLAGATTRRRAAGQALAGLGCGALCLWAATTVILVAVGRSASVGIGAGAAAYFALALALPGVVFLAVGALAGQLAATARQAAGYAAAVLGVSYALRLVADSGVGVEWLRWASPLGWIEELRPLTTPRPLALLPAAVTVVVLCAATVTLAGRRDLGASVLPDRAGGPSRTRLLFGPLGLALRLSRGTLAGWAAAIAALAVVVGAVARSAERAITSSPTIAHVFSRLGAPGAGARAYLGVTFLMLAVLVALVGTGQLGAARDDEAQGRLDNLLVRPVSRGSWLAGRLALAVAATVAGGLLAGLCAWLGGVGHVGHVPLPTLLAAGLNVVPPALCILGAGTLVLGLRPRVTALAVYALLTWSVLVEVLAGTVKVSHWVLDSSVFHEMAAAPAVAPDWTSAAVMVAIGVGAGLAGVLLFARRDLQGE